MADKFTKEQRSLIMSKVRGKNTTPEIKVRKLLHSMGYRFRLHRHDLPGKPDIVLPKYRTVIFVNGCFWHGCPICRRAKIRPVNNSEYWNKKLDRNIQRDNENYKKINELGWRAIVVWECETRDKNMSGLRDRLSDFLNTKTSCNNADL